MRKLLFSFWLCCEALSAAPRQIDDHHWQDVDRIIAIGDLHGDWDSYLAVLQAAGVTDRRGRWKAGQTHLVQTGDVPDRGPDTRRIIEHLAQLARQARKRGGRVHALTGNHEAMNVYGDLRYTVPGEFAAWADARSPVRREATHPLGWFEHRRAWDPRQNARAPMYRWVMQAPVAVQLDGHVFLHGGISHSYCGNSLQSLTDLVHAALERADPSDRGILTDPLGPLWYRGLAGVAPAARRDSVDQILETRGARRIVIGHTTTGGVIWPRLDGRVIQIDTGMSRAYGRRIGWLEISTDGLQAGYPGGRVPLPTRDQDRLAYLDAVIALQPDNEALRERRAALLSGELEAPQAQADAGEPVSCGTSG
ncbi:MAG: metallophosphoesterase [Xanthomonadales bacterium]|nr:hypothetical protein [Xanthomonadales bacterium]MCC6592513.1 metallophosphoesterase [Xanthomonadales bacterium]MCE7931507.1 protein-tyrosine-phosphatase [Xanthomonadales bacterium PRO6]